MTHPPGLQKGSYESTMRIVNAMWGVRTRGGWTIDARHQTDLLGGHQCPD
jgi:hypothetical protein